MSYSKDKLQAEEQRQPKCCRCRHHGSIVLKKGHRSCPFVGCRCWKCALIDQRSEITAHQRRLNKARSNAQTSPGHGGAGVAVSGPPGSLNAGVTAASDASASASASPGSPAGPRRSTGGGEESSSGSESREQLPQAQNSSGFDSEDVGPLPFIPFPFVDSNVYPRLIPVRGQYIPNMPWMPSPPAGFYNGRPLMFQQGPMHHPAQAGTANSTNYRQYVFGIPPLPPMGLYQHPLLPAQQRPLPPAQQRPVQRPLLPAQQHPAQQHPVQRPLLPAQQHPAQQHPVQRPLLPARQQPLLSRQRLQLLPQDNQQATGK